MPIRPITENTGDVDVAQFYTCFRKWFDSYFITLS